MTIFSGVSFQEDDSCGASVETEYLNNLFISVQCISSGITEEVKLSQKGCALGPCGSNLNSRALFSLGKWVVKP